MNLQTDDKAFLEYVWDMDINRVLNIWPVDNLQSDWNSISLLLMYRPNTYLTMVALLEDFSDTYTESAIPSTKQELWYLHSLVMASGKKGFINSWVCLIEHCLYLRQHEVQRVQDLALHAEAFAKVDMSDLASLAIPLEDVDGRYISPQQLWNSFQEYQQFDGKPANWCVTTVHTDPKTGNQCYIEYGSYDGLSRIQKIESNLMDTDPYSVPQYSQTYR